LALGYSSLILETPNQPDDVAARDPGKSLHLFNLGWRHRTAGRVDYGLLLERHDGAGWLFETAGWLRFGDSEESFWLRASLGLLHTTWDAGQFHPLLRYGAGAGSDWGSHCQVMFENMGPIPLAPGFSVAENNAFSTKGQLDLGGLAIWGNYSRIVRLAGDDFRIRQDVGAGLALISETSRFFLGWVMLLGSQARYRVDGDGQTINVRLTRRAMGLRMGYGFFRKNSDGLADRHQFGLTVYPGQKVMDKDGADWSSKRPEFAFTWSAEFGL
jgi:hypothetical protein